MLVCSGADYFVNCWHSGEETREGREDSADLSRVNDCCALVKGCGVCERWACLQCPMWPDSDWVHWLFFNAVKSALLLLPSHLSTAVGSLCPKRVGFIVRSLKAREKERGKKAQFQNLVSCLATYCQNIAPKLTIYSNRVWINLVSKLTAQYFLNM